MAINNVITDDWSGHSHGEVEEALKDKLSEMSQDIEEAAQAGYAPPAGGIPYNDLAKAVRDILDSVEDKVDKVNGKGLSAEDFTSAFKAKLEGLGNYDDTQIWAAVNTLRSALGGLATVATSGSYNDLTDKPNIPAGSEADAALSDTSENAVQNKVVKAAIDSLRNALDTLIGSGNVQGAIDTFNEIKAFLEGIDTDDPTLFNQLKNLSDAITALQTAINNVYTKSEVDGMIFQAGGGTVTGVKMNNGQPIEPDLNGVINLGTVITSHQDISGKAEKSEMSVTDGTGANADKTTIQLKSGTSAQVLKQHQDVSHLASKSYVDQAVEQATQGETVVTSVDDVVIIDGFNSNTVLAAPSARAIKELYLNLQALRSELAGIAFKSGLPDWQTVPQITYSMDYTGLTNFATPQTTSWVEGSEVTVALSAASGFVLNASVASSITVTDVNDNDVTLSQQPTFDSISGTITFKIANIDKDFKVAGTALAALSVALQANSGLMLSANGVISGDTFSATVGVSNSNTHKLPADITSSNVSGSCGTVTFTRTSDTQGTLVITNVTSDLTINASAVAWGTYNVTFPASTDHILVKDLQDNVLTSPVSVSENNNGWSCKVYAGPDYLLSGAPTASMQGGGTISVGSQNQDGSYTISTSKVTGDVTITATAQAPARHTITLQERGANGVGNLKMYTDAEKTTEIQSGVQVLDGQLFTAYIDTASPYSSVNARSAFKEIVWDTENTNGYPITVMSGNDDVTASAYKPVKLVYGNNDMVRVELVVTDDVVITLATATYIKSCIVSTAAGAISTSDNVDYEVSDYIEIPATAKRFAFTRSTMIEDWAIRQIALVHQGKTSGETYNVGNGLRSNIIDGNETFAYFRLSLNSYNRRNLFLLFFDENGDATYALRGINCDGRLLDDYGCVFGRGLNSSNTVVSNDGSNTAPEGQNATFYTDYLPVDQYESISYYTGATATYNRILQFDDNKTKIGEKTDGTAKKTISITSTKFVRLSTNEKNAYIFGQLPNGNYEWIFRGLSYGLYFIGVYSSNVEVTHLVSGSAVVDTNPFFSNNSITNYTIKGTTGYTIVDTPTILMGGETLDISANSGNSLTNNGDGTYTLTIGRLTGDVRISATTQETA